MTHATDHLLSRLAGLLLGIALCAQASPGLAQPSADRADAALAEGLFQDAKKLLEQGQHATACPKLAESHRLDPAGGTILLLGLCYEATARWASAWAAFNEAVGMAIKDNRPDREQRARERLAVVEGKVARLSLRIPASLAALPGLALSRGDKEIPAPAWTSTLPVDPGRHALRASAPGRQPVTVEVSIPEEGGVVPVQLPASLPELPAEAGPARSSAPARSSTPARRAASSYAPLGLGALGLVSIGLGAALGLRALAKDSEADQLCASVRCEDRRAIQFSSDARSSARASNVAFALGGLALGAGVMLYVLQAPGRVAASGRLQVALAPQGRPAEGGSVYLSGGF